MSERRDAASTASTAWAATPRPERAAALEAVAAALDAAVDELVDLAIAETALPEARLRGEVARTSGQLRMFAERVRDGSYLEAVISPAADARPDVRRLLVPIGPVAVYAASNFPFAFSVAGGDTASALAAGCAVRVKVHDGHPRTSARTAQIVRAALAAAGAPDGLFDTVEGFAAGRDLVQDPAIRAAGFTGSQAGGRALYDLAAARPDPIPFYAELGSVNPVVVLPGAVRERGPQLARDYVASLTLGVGQFCTNPGLLFAPDDDSFRAAIAEALAAASGGRMLTDKITDGFAAAVRAPEWTVLDVVGRGTGPDGGGLPEARTVPLADFVADPRLGEERFGPAGLIVTYDAVEDLPAALAAVPGSLTASVHAAADEHPTVAGLAEVLAPRAGRLIMNGWPTGVAVCWAMHHGGPWPATTSVHTSVGATALRRWLVPIAYQDWPDDLLPRELQAANPLGVARLEQPA